MTETPEALRARHLRLNVALRRLGYHMPACDGPQCPVCVALSDALSLHPEGDAASALSPDVRERLQGLEVKWREEADHRGGIACGSCKTECADELRNVLAARPSEPPQDECTTHLTMGVCNRGTVGCPKQHPGPPAASSSARYALHASAPKGLKCSDCTIDGEPCQWCYTAWWRARHPTVERTDPSAVTGGSLAERKGEMHTCPVCGPECSC